MYAIMYVEELTQIVMKTDRTLSITEARKEIFKIANEVQKPDVHYVLTENGKPKAVIMSAEEFESWRETLEVMEMFPDLHKDIEELERDIKTGKVDDYTTFEELLAEDGLTIADLTKTENDVSNNFGAEGKKGSKKNK